MTGFRSKRQAAQDKLADPILLTFKAEEIFHNIPDDPNSVLMQFPDQVLGLVDWKEGDTLRFTQLGDTIHITKNRDD